MNTTSSDPINTAATSTLGVEIRGLTQRFGTTTALDGVNVSLRPGVVTGLLGRSGAGKSTLCRLVGALVRPLQGTVDVGGEPVWENADRASRVYVMREQGVLSDGVSIAAVVDLHRRMRPHWDGDVFTELLDQFEVPARRTPAKLSTGRKSALRAALALASRAEVTILDEGTAGMDAVLRRQFYEAVVAEYAHRPRTLVISSHLIDEIEPLVEDVVLLDRGRVVDSGEADDVRARHSHGGRLASLTDVLVDLSTTETL